MKNIFFIFGLTTLVMSFRLNNDSKLLYHQALLTHVSNLKTDTIYVLKCFDIELPSKIGKHIIVDISENINFFMGNSTSLYAIKLMPIELNKGNVEITLIDYILKSNNDEIAMNNTGNVIYSYKYENETGKYKLLKKIKNTI